MKETKDTVIEKINYINKELNKLNIRKVNVKELDNYIDFTKLTLYKSIGITSGIYCLSATIFNDPLFSILPSFLCNLPILCNYLKNEFIKDEYFCEVKTIHDIDYYLTYELNILKDLLKYFNDHTYIWGKVEGTSEFKNRIAVMEALLYEYNNRIYDNIDGYYYDEIKKIKRRMLN